MMVPEKLAQVGHHEFFPVRVARLATGPALQNKQLLVRFFRWPEASAAAQPQACSCPSQTLQALRAFLRVAAQNSRWPAPSSTARFAQHTRHGDFGRLEGAPFGSNRSRVPGPFLLLYHGVLSEPGEQGRRAARRSTSNRAM